MPDHPDIDTLRAWLQRDQAAFRAQSQRLDEIQRTKAEDLTPADRNAVFNWDSSVIKTCEQHLGIMDTIENPTAEQKQIQSGLANIVFLGDHIMERRNLVRDQLGEKLGKVDMTPATLEPQAAAPTAASPAPAEGLPAAEQPKRAPTPIPAAPAPAADPEPPKAGPTEPEPEPEQEDIDPKQLYQILKVKPDASLDVIKK